MISETDKIKMQAELIEIFDKWLDNHGDIYQCSELPRLMAGAALAVAEASTIAEREGGEADQ